MILSGPLHEEGYLVLGDIVSWTFYGDLFLLELTTYVACVIGMLMCGCVCD